MKIQDRELSKVARECRQEKEFAGIPHLKPAMDSSGCQEFLYTLLLIALLETSRAG